MKKIILLFLCFLTTVGWGEVIGKSVRGRAIHVYSYGKGEETILFVGGIHGDEPQGVEILSRFRQLLVRQPSLYRGVRVVIVPNANPDGRKRRSRVNARGVDINRNFPTKSFSLQYRKEAYYPGLRPASEPETRALMRLIDRYKPSLVVTLHAQLHCILSEGNVCSLVKKMQYYTHYPVVTNLGYETPGSFGHYCQERGIPMITIEVPRLPYDALWEQNKPALLEVLRHPPGKEAKEMLVIQTKTNPSLFEALQRPDWYLYRGRFTNQAEWKKTDKNGDTPLHLAIRRGDTSLALSLIEKGIHLATTNRKGWSPLFDAVYYGNLEVVKALLHKGISPDSSDPLKWRPLLIAAQRGDREMVRLLLDAGASVNAQDRYGYTALMEAVRAQHGEVVNDLLARGADPLLTNKYGLTASRQAILARSTNVLSLLGGGQ